MKTKIVILLIMTIVFINLWGRTEIEPPAIYEGRGVFEEVALDELFDNVDGDFIYVIIASKAGSQYYEMRTDVKSGYSIAEPIEPSLNQETERSFIYHPDPTRVWKITKDDTNYTIQNIATINKKNQGMFLAYSGSGTKLSLVMSVSTNAHRWTIDSEGKGFRNASAPTRGLIFRSNLDIKRFTGYATSNLTQQHDSYHDVILFRYTDAISVPFITLETFDAPPTENDEFELKFTVEKGEPDLDSVKLHYTINDAEHSFTMTGNINNVEYTIPSSTFNDGDVVKMWIEATDANTTIRADFQPFLAGTTSIEEARKADDHGFPLYRDYLVRVSGIVLNDPDYISTAPVDFFMQEGTAGIGVYYDPTYGTSTFVDKGQRGHNYTVIGTIDHYEGATFIIPNSIDEGGVEEEPKPLIGEPTEYFTTFDTAEDHEGSLIQLTDMAIDGLFPSTLHGNYGTPYQWVTLVDLTGKKIRWRLTEAIHQDLLNITDINFNLKFDIIGILSQQMVISEEDDLTAYEYKEDYFIFVRDADEISFNPVLPVTITDFSGTANPDASVTLNWTTETEYNILGYHILRNQVNDITTAKIISPEMIAANNISLSQTYEFTDINVTSGVEYYYWLKVIELNGTEDFYGPNIVTVADINLTLETKIISMFPNPLPAMAEAVFNVHVKANETAKLRIYNIRGQMVKEFPVLTNGNHNINWDGRDNIGRQTSSGIYFYQLSSQTHNDVRKMIIIK